MKKIIILLFLLTNILFSNTLQENEIYYIKDDNNLTYKDINKSSELKLVKNHHLGFSNTAIWTKVILKNNTNKAKSITLYNSLAGINKIDVFILQNNKLKEKKLLGDLREQSLRSSITRYSNFNIIINANESYEIISKIENYYIYDIGWKILNSDDFYNLEQKKIFIAGLLGGFFFLFCLFNLINFYIYRSVEYLIISGIIVSLVSYQYGFHGIFYFLNMNINLNLITALTWNSSLLAGFFIVMFSSYFFKQKQKYKKLFYITNTLMISFLALIVLILYAQFYDEKYFNYSWLIALIVLISTSYLFVLSIYMYKRKEVGSLYYLIGQGSLLIGVSVNTLGLFNIIPYYEVVKFLIPVCYIIDVFAMLTAIFIKDKIEQKELRNAKVQLIEQSRFNSIGQAIGDISHQWKNPLTKVGTSITLLETVYNHDQKETLNVLEKQLPLIKNSLSLMQKSMYEFSTYYNTKNLKEEYLAYKSVNNVLQLLQSKIILKKAKVDLDIKEDLNIFGFEHILSNIMMVLIDNSLDEFEEKNTNNKIYIVIKKEINTIKITYTDNAGGIKIRPVEKIFDYFKSTKNSENNSGNGLAIVKILVKDRLSGKIFVKNTNDGALFTIIMPN